MKPCRVCAGLVGVTAAVGVDFFSSLSAGLLQSTAAGLSFDELVDDFDCGSSSSLSAAALGEDAADSEYSEIDSSSFILTLSAVSFLSPFSLTLSFSASFSSAFGFSQATAVVALSFSINVSAPFLTTSLSASLSSGASSSSDSDSDSDDTFLVTFFSSSLSSATSSSSSSSLHGCFIMFFVAALLGRSCFVSDASLSESSFFCSDSFSSSVSVQGFLIALLEAFLLGF